MQIFKAIRRGVSTYRREAQRCRVERRWEVPREELSRIATGQGIIPLLLMLVLFYIAAAVFDVDFDKYFPKFLALITLAYAASLSRRLDATLELLRRDGRAPEPGA